jgi:hypothetical protein
VYIVNVFVYLCTENGNNKKEEVNIEILLLIKKLKSNSMVVEITGEV